MTLDDLFLPPQTLPVIPAVVQALIQALGDETSDNSTLAELIARDAALSAQVLRRANSAAFKLAQPVGSIAQALALLGTMNVRALVISVGLFSSFCSIKPALLKPFWRTSLRMAAAAQHWSTRPGMRLDAQLAHTLGLLYPIGQLMLLASLPEEVARINARVHPLAPQRLSDERAQLGFGFTDVGAELARRWQFPGLFVDVIGGAALAQPDPNGAALAALVRLAAWQTWQGEVQATPAEVAQTWPSDWAAQAGLQPEYCGVHFPPWPSLCGALESALG